MPNFTFSFDNLYSSFIAVSEQVDMTILWTSFHILPKGERLSVHVIVGKQLFIY